MLWQYRTVLFEFTKDGLLGDRYVDDEEMETALNQLGRQSWELVNVSLLQDGLLAILKRPIEEKNKTEPVVSRAHERMEPRTEQHPVEPAVTDDPVPPVQPNRPPISMRGPVGSEPEQSDPLAPRRGFERSVRPHREAEDNDFVGGIRIS
jgi:hypothetical protein